ncbi:aldehyde dehydrogenase family protein, partial [Streptomyces sp. NPDC006356]
MALQRRLDQTTAVLLELAAHRIATTRMLKGGQVCLCPDYVFVPRSAAEEFTAALQAELAGLFPTYTDNPAAVPIVNERNFDRVLGLIEDAVEKGARRVTPIAEGPSRADLLIPPTLLLDVPAEAQIEREEVFGP